jgi:carboxylate-amine ligase
MRAELGIEPGFPELNGAQRQRRMIKAGASREEVFAASVKETRQTYSQEVTV